MATIDMDSIMRQAEWALTIPRVRERMKKRAGEILTTPSEGRNRHLYADLELGAKKFVEILISEIESCKVGADKNFSNGQLGSTAIDALTKLTCGKPEKIDDYLFRIGISFSENLKRESLAPELYDGIDNIAALLNSGYTAGHAVYGIWKGHGDKRRPSLVERDGAHFIEAAIRYFMDNYAKEFNVSEIVVDEAYK